jgi:hypothetical protein
MVDQSRLWAASVDRHVQRIEHEPGPQVVRHGPANDLPGVGVEHEREVEPSLPGTVVRDVCDPQAVRGPGVKLRSTRSGVGGVCSAVSAGWCEPSSYTHRVRTTRPLASASPRVFWRTSRPAFSTRSGSSAHRRSHGYLYGCGLSSPKVGRLAEPKRKAIYLANHRSHSSWRPSTPWTSRSPGGLPSETR